VKKRSRAHMHALTAVSLSLSLSLSRARARSLSLCPLGGVRACGGDTPERKGTDPDSHVYWLHLRGVTGGGTDKWGRDRQAQADKMRV
jgi:hypothetical protein